MPERIASTIATQDDLWFPGLAAQLAASVSAVADRRWVDGQYGTVRWLAGDPAASRDTVDEVALPCLAAVERLDVAACRRFPDLCFASGDLTAAKPALEAAVALLGVISGLSVLMGALVRSIHVLVARPGYDVSHSDPDLPFSIFVSLPEPGEPHAVARLAESVLHESLHLQLTLIESHLPLVAEPAREGFSPWKNQVRPLGGVLHGLYVFAVISQVLGRLAESSKSLSAYAERRRCEIVEEVRMLGEPPLGLTATGHWLWAHAYRAATRL